jgi:hypothetical protein
MGAGGGGGAPAPDILLSGSPDSVYENRTDLKVGSKGLVVVAWVAHPATRPSFIGVALSSNDGASFSAAQELTSPGGRSSDHPTLLVTPSNDVWVSWLGFVPSAGTGGTGTTDTHVYVARSMAGQTPFDTPVEVTAPTAGTTFDWPRIGMSPAGTLVDAYEAVDTSGSSIVVARSTDDGTSWTPATLPLESGYYINGGQRPYPCLLAQGAPSSGTQLGVGVMGGALGDAATGMGIVFSDDDGLDWNDDDFYGDAASVAGPRCVLSGQSSWLAYGFGSDTVGDNTLPMEDAAVRVDAETGFTAVQGFDDSTFPTHFLNPEMAVDAAGNVYLAYYAGKHDGDPAGSYRITLDDGTPVATSVAPTVKSGLTFAIADVAAQNWLGDYTGFALQGNFLFSSYVDNSSGASHVAFHRTVLP